MTPNQNPFSAFKFDPNDAESQLDSLSSQMTNNINERNACTTPLNLNTIKRSRFLTSGTIVRTPASSGKMSSVLSAKRKRISNGRTNRITDHDLLKLKALEQQSYFTPKEFSPPITTNEHNERNNAFYLNQSSFNAGDDYAYQQYTNDLHHRPQHPPPFINRLIEEIYPSQLSQHMNHDGRQDNMFSCFQSQNFEECTSYNENFNEMGMPIDSNNAMINLITKDGYYQQNSEVPSMFEDLRTFDANSFDNLASSQSQNQNNIFSQNYQSPSSDTPMIFNATSMESQLPPSNSSIFNSQQEYDLNCFQMPTTTRSEILNPYKKSKNSNYFKENNRLPINPALDNNENVLQESFESSVQTSTSSGVANLYQNSNDHQNFMMIDTSCAIIQNDGHDFEVSKTNDHGNNLNDDFEDAFL